VELLSRLTTVPESCPAEVLAAVRFQLVNGGVDKNALARQMINIEQDLNRLLLDQRGRWLISSEHRDAKSELSLWHRETQRELIIDRTFIDITSGTRWVIDYKSSQPGEGEPLDQFIARESQKYKDQLQTYCTLINIYDEESKNAKVDTKAALYFPAVAVFAEVTI
jgi:ATP-dependent exoDNAse (exonuclease V) beta subunit